MNVEPRLRSRGSPQGMALVYVAALVLAACDTITTASAVEMVAGTYTAIEFRLMTAEDTTDVLKQGGRLHLRLDVDGTVSGELFVPGGDEDGGDLLEDMAGTWSLKGDVVTFDQDADTFVRDTPFRVRGEELVAEWSDSEGDVRVVLVRAVTTI